MTEFKFAYLRDPKDERRVLTICTSISEDSGMLHSRLIKYSIALSNPDAGDRFVKKIGRNITMGRMKAKLSYTILVPDGVSILPEVVKALSCFFTNRISVRHICKHWLKENGPQAAVILAEETKLDQEVVRGALGGLPRQRRDSGGYLYDDPYDSIPF